MLVVGLTGGIGSGKTTVANLFAELGVPIIDTDLIARQLVEPGKPALADIVRQFGDEILQADGELDRSRLADISFRDKALRLRLEAILHPAIRQEMLRQLKNLQAAYAIVVIPLLVETGQSQGLDRVLLVDCPEAEQITRVSKRDGRPLQQIQAILQSQATRQQRQAIADDVILNGGSLDDLRQQVRQLDHKYRTLTSH
jgi:dephospho-CoA kinase